MEHIDVGAAHWGTADLPDVWLSATEAADMAGVSRQTVYVWIHGGLLETRREDGTTRVRQADLHHLDEVRRIAAEKGMRVKTIREFAD